MSLFKLLEKIIASEGDVARLKLPEEKINLLSLKILKKEAERRGKKLKLKASGVRGKRLIASLEDGAEPEPRRIIKGKFKVPRIKRASVKRVSLIPLIILAVLLILFGVGYWLVNFLPRAEVILTLEPTPMVKEVSLSASTNAVEIDVKKAIIPGSELTVEVSGQKSTPATGSTTVGEKATGTTTLISVVAQHCIAGAKLRENDSNLVFILDNPVDLGVAPLSEDVTVTAEKIGEEYNLAIGKNFYFLSGCASPGAVVGSNSTTAFTGGDSHEVKLVTAADQTKVLNALRKELVAEGKKDLASEAGLDQQLVQGLVKQKVLEKSFAQAVGEEADEASLTLKMDLTTIVYNGEDLEEFISQIMEDLIPKNYELFPGEMEMETLDSSLGKEVLNFSAKIVIQVIPKIDLEEIKNNIAGKSASAAQTYLSSLSNVNAYELLLYPNLPERFLGINIRRVPKNRDKITIERRTDSPEEEETET